MLLPLKILSMRNVINFLYGILVTIALVLTHLSTISWLILIFKRNIERICIEKYNISNVLSNDLDAINAEKNMFKIGSRTVYLICLMLCNNNNIIVLSTKVLYVFTDVTSFLCDLQYVNLFDAVKIIIIIIKL